MKKTFLWATLALGMAAFPRAASAEVEVRHEITLGLAGIWDVGYDRGLRYGAAYELGLSSLRIGATLAAGDTDPRREQHWSLYAAFEPLSAFRGTLALHHRTFTTSRFGDNTLTALGSLRFRGLLFDAGIGIRFPITRPSQIHSPVTFDRELLESHPLVRLGYLWALPRQVRFGVETGNLSRFELRNLNHPSFALVVEWSSPALGTLRGEVGFGTAGFFSQGSTIDRGFVRLELSRAIP